MSVLRILALLAATAAALPAGAKPVLHGAAAEAAFVGNHVSTAVFSAGSMSRHHRGCAAVTLRCR